MTKMISEILEEASRMPPDMAVAFLRSVKTVPLLHLLKLALDRNIEILLPPGAPPYNKSELHENHGMFMSEARKLYLFVKGQSPELHQIRRETLFINMLESIHPQDAEMLIAAKDKKLMIDAKIVMEAFPELQLDPVDQSYLTELPEVAVGEEYFPDDMEMLLKSQTSEIVVPKPVKRASAPKKPGRKKKTEIEVQETKPTKRKAKK